MNETCILEKSFLFEAHNEKAFHKLRDNQFARLTQGLIQEPFSNAMDQQPPHLPVRVTLRSGRRYAVLTFEDDGEGLTSSNLEALHFIGKSTKRADRDNKIGRFGMGLVGAFHRKLQVRRMFITSTVCGKPARVTIRCRDNGIPLWHMRELTHPVRGFAISFWFPLSQHGLVKKELDAFFRDCIVPATYNGREIARDPRDLIVLDGDLVGEHRDGDLHVLVATALEPQSSFHKRDDMRIYLRRMLVEKTDSAYHAFRSGGDKMAQNSFTRPYLDNESILVSSRIGEPTVGRDKLLRGSAFDRIHDAIGRARVGALLQLLPAATDAQASERARKNAIQHVLANLSALGTPVAARIQGKPLPPEQRYLVPLIDRLLETPVFAVCDSKTLLSVRDILLEPFPGGLVFYASEPELFHEFQQELNTPFVLHDARITMEEIWGYHPRRPVQDILKSIINSLEGFSMASLDDLVWDEDKQRELVRKGVLKRRAVRIHRATSMSPAQEEFLERLKTLLNKPWFRAALGRFDPPARIRLHPIVEEPSTLVFRPEIVAAVIGHDPRHRELDIGIHFDSAAVKTLMEAGSADPAFLPILCHELAHRKRNLDDGEEGLVGHTRGFYYDRVRLEDSVLQNCVRHLCGEEPDPTDETPEQVLVL